MLICEDVQLVSKKLSCSDTVGTVLMLPCSHETAILQSIETVNVDGSGRHSFPEILEDEDPVGLAVFANSFFWANKMQLLHASPRTPKERAVLLNISVAAFSVLHESQQPRSKSKACFCNAYESECILNRTQK